MTIFLVPRPECGVGTDVATTQNFRRVDTIERALEITGGSEAPIVTYVYNNEHLHDLISYMKRWPELNLIVLQGDKDEDAPTFNDLILAEFNKPAPELLN